MALSERLALLITANGSQAVGELNRVGTAANRSLATTEQATARTQANLTRLGIGFVTMGGLAAYGMYQAGQAAADLEQAVGGTEAVFGEASSIIDEFASQAAESMGLSEQAFRDGTTRIGALLTNMGYSQEEAANEAVRLSQIAADLGATLGKDTAEGLHAMGRALVGEFDPLESYAVQLRQADINARALADTGKTSAESLTQQEKATAALALITEKASFAQGQFAREADTAAGAQAIMAAEWDNLVATIGAGALPVMTTAFGAISRIIGAFQALNNVTGGNLGNFAAWAAGMALVGGAALLLTVKLWALASTAIPAVVSAAETAALMFMSMPGPVQAFIVAATAAAVAAGVLTGKLEEIPGAGESIEIDWAAVAGNPEVLIEHFDGVEGGIEAIRAAAEQGGIPAAQALADAWIEMGGPAAEVTGVMEELYAAEQASAAASDAAAQAALEFAAANGDQAAAAQLAADAIDQLSAEIDAYLEEIHSVPAAQDDLAESFQALEDSLRENGGAWQGSTEGAIANDRAGRDVVATYAAMVESMNRQNASHAELRAAATLSIGRLKSLRDQGVITGTQFQQLRREILNVPGSKNINVSLSGADAVISDLQAIYREANRAASAVNQISGSLAGGGTYGRAHGGFIREGERSMVHGGEMVSVQGGKATVTPAVSVRAGGGGGPVTLSKRSIRDLAYAINQGAADRPIFARGYD